VKLCEILKIKKLSNGQESNSISLLPPCTTTTCEYFGNCHLTLCSTTQLDVKIDIKKNLKIQRKGNRKI